MDTDWYQVLEDTGSVLLISIVLFHKIKPNWINMYQVAEILTAEQTLNNNITEG